MSHFPNTVSCRRSSVIVRLRSDASTTLYRVQSSTRRMIVFAGCKPKSSRVNGEVVAEKEAHS